MKHNVEGLIGEGQALRIAQVEIGLQIPATQVALAVSQHLGGKIESGKLHIARQIFVVEPGAHRCLQHRIAGFHFEPIHIAAEMRVPVDPSEGKKDALDVVIESADSFIQVVVFTVIAGQVFRLEKGWNSIANREALPGDGDQRFAMLFAHHTQGFAGKRAAQQRDRLRSFGPCPLLLRAEERPDAENQSSAKAYPAENSMAIPALWQDHDIEMQSKPQADGSATNRNKNNCALVDFCRAELVIPHPDHYGGKPANEERQETVF